MSETGAAEGIDVRTLISLPRDQLIRTLADVVYDIIKTNWELAEVRGAILEDYSRAYAQVDGTHSARDRYAKSVSEPFRRDVTSLEARLSVLIEMKFFVVRLLGDG